MKKSLLTMLALGFFAANAFGQAIMSERLLDEISRAEANNAPVKALVMLKDQADIQKLDADLYAMKSSLEYRAYTVITTLQRKADETQGPLLSMLAAKRTTEVLNYRGFWIVNMIAVEAVPSALWELSRHADVGHMDVDAKLVLDKPVRRSAGKESMPNGAEPGLKAINAHRMWAAGFTGTGRLVMGDDTGVDFTVPAFGARWRGHFAPRTQAWFNDGAPSTANPDDCDNHGTHTMGTMTGLVTATNDTIGVAFGAQWIASNGLCTNPHTSVSIAAWQWAMNPDSNPATIHDMPDAIGNSWYDPSIGDECSPATNPYYNAIINVEASGIAIIFSAGNSGPGASTLTKPKNMNMSVVQAFAVGAVNANTSWPYAIADFSSRGPSVCIPPSGTDSAARRIKPEVVAPGVSVRSTIIGGGFANYDGTSMACPHVVGAIALLRQARPNITGYEAKMALYMTARDLGPAGEDNDYGRGMIDVWAAYQSLADPTDPKPVTGVDIYSDYTTPTAVTVTWTDPTEFEDGSPLDTFVVDLYRGTTLVGTVPKGEETFIETGLTNHQVVNYDLYVRHIPTDSLSSKVATGPWYAGGHPTPSAPGNFAAQGYSNRAELTWTDPTTNVDGTPIGDLDSIRIFRDGVHLANVLPGVQAYTDMSVTGGYYNYKVQAIDDETPVNASAFTSEIQVYAGPQPDIAVNPDPLQINLLAGAMGLDSFYIYNTGDANLVISGIEAEEVSATAFVPTWTQEQKFTPELPKGVNGPTYPAQTEGSGGPDPFGYRWKDSDEPGGPAVNFINISATGTPITFSSNDDATATIPLAFPVKFYGNTYSGNLTVSTNGWVGYDTYTSNYLSNAAIPATALPNNIIAPFWDDLNGNNAGSKVVYQAVGNKFIVQWVNWNRYGNTGGDLNFQVILTQNSDKVEIQYATMTQGTGTTNSHTIGIENSGGTMGLQVVFDAAYIKSNHAIVFGKGVEWLAMTPTTGTVAAGDSMKVYTQINSTGLLGGLHKAKAIINHNIPLVPPYGHPEIWLQITGVPNIAVSPSSLNFGTKYITQPYTMTFNVQSSGTDTLEVTGFATNTPQYSVLTTVPFKLAATATKVCTVQFQAATPGTYDDTVYVTSNGVNGVQKIALTAVAIDNPVMVITPDTLFYELLTNELDTTSFTISNTGLGELRITNIEAEEVTTEAFVPTWTQEQKYTPDYPKGSVEPTFGTQTEGKGGPDPFGYKWIDSDEPGGPSYDWFDISAIGTAITSWTGGGDDGYAEVTLPFAFKFYGTPYNSIYAGTNGILSFGSGTSALSNAAIPSSATPNNFLAPMWDDLDASSGSVKYYHDAANGRFIIQYNVVRYGTSSQYLFQVMLYTSGKIVYQYNTMAGTRLNEATIGIENDAGTMGLQVVFNANYVHNSLAIVFQKGVDWLTFGPKSDTLNTGESMDVEVIANATSKLGGTYFAKFLVESNDPAHQPVWEKPIVKLRVIGVPDIGVSPALLDFGTIFTGVSDTMEITVTNTGSDLLTVTGLSLTQGIPQYTIVTAVPFNVPISGNQKVKIAFNAATPGTFTDTVLVVSNGNSGDKRVALTGTTINPPIIAVSDTLITRTVSVGDTNDSEMTIWNIGYSDLAYSIKESENVFTFLTKNVNSSAPRAADINYGGPHSIGRAPAVNTQLTGNVTEQLTGNVMNAFAVKVYPDPKQFSRFNLSAPGTFIPKGTLTADVFAGDFSTDGSVYWAADYTGGTFGTIDTVTGSYSVIGTITGITSGQSITGLTVDPTTEVIYLSTTNVTTSELYTINPSTAVTTLIGSITGMAGTIDIAVNPAGQMYGYCIVSDHFYSINKATGVATDIGALGFNANYAQGMDFDPNDGTCYLAAYSTQGELRTVDLSTGASTLIGAFPGGAEVDGLGILSLGLPWIDASPISGSITPGDSAVITLSWYGIQSGLFNGYLGISSNDPSSPMTNVRVQLTVPVGIEDETTRPASYALHQNYPNPFNPTTTIKYDLKDAGKVTLKIYNILGQEVRSLVNKNETAGFKSVVWDGKDNAGRMVSSGLYIYRIETGKFVKSHKMMFLK